MAAPVSSGAHRAARPRDEDDPRPDDHAKSYFQRIEFFSAASHLAGAGLSIAALAVAATDAPSGWHLASAIIFGLAALLLYSTSAFYHFLPRGSRLKRVLRRVDHAMIFVFIAASVTPMCLIALNGPFGWILFGLMWYIALLGVIMKSASEHLPGWLNGTIYVAMGWLGALAFLPGMGRAIPAAAIGWFIGGGLSYTVGAAIYGYSKRLPHPLEERGHDIFHLFVVFGSVCHFLVLELHLMGMRVD